MRKFQTISIMVSAAVLAVAAVPATYACPPKVISAVPDNGQSDVDPALKRVHIEFDQDMDTRGYSICGGGSKFPETLGKPRWVNKQTIVMAVKLEPDREYEMSVNCPSYQNFKNPNGEVAEIYPIKFRTGAIRSASGEESESPAILLQKGVHAEETEGNLDKAIEIYQRVIEEADRGQMAAAQATYHLGMCYLKKGDAKEAADYFQQVVSNYATERAVAEEANKQLEKMGIQNESAKNLFDILGPEASAYIRTKYKNVCVEAGAKKVYSSGPMYLVDEDFVLRQGGMGFIMNCTGKPIRERHFIGGTFAPNQKRYDADGNAMDIEIVPDKNRKGFYQIYWTPKEPLKPGDFFRYRWAMDGSTRLSSDAGGANYNLVMQSVLGRHALETFFLIVPEGTTIVSQSEKYTAKDNFQGWDIYWWKTEVLGDTNHIVNVTLAGRGSEPANTAPPPKAISFYPENGAVDVPYGKAVVRIKFDQPMNPRIAGTSGRGGPRRHSNCDFNYDASKNEFSIDCALMPGKHYTVCSNDYRPFMSIDGRPAEDFEFSFTTAPPPQNKGVKPRVVAVTPAPGTVWTRFTNLQIEFDQPVIPSSGRFSFTPGSFNSGAVPPVLFDEKPTKTIVVPLLLTTSGIVHIHDFVSESEVTCEPYDVEFSLSNKMLSPEMEEYLRRCATDPRLISLIENIQKASREIKSVCETVQATSLSAGYLMADYGIFRFQRPNQFYCDISAIMKTPFKIGGDGKNCWFFAGSKDQPVRYYKGAYSEFGDIDLEIVRPFPVDQDAAEIIQSRNLEYVGNDEVSGTKCEIIRSYQFDYRSPQILTYWIDGRSFLPVRIITASPHGKYRLDFTYDSLNTALGDEEFKYDGPDAVAPVELEPLRKGYTERSIIVHDGSSGRMSSRWGMTGPKGTSGSGLN